jgi:EmrB/QacA subfamily drug resistance transporter
MQNMTLANRPVAAPTADAVPTASPPRALRDMRPRSLASPAQVLAIVSVGICLANLDLFIVNVGLPAIGRDFGGATLEDLSWILNGYAIAYAALLVFFGRLAERYRRNMSFLLGVALFTLASAACAAADNVGALALFRLVQAAGAALMTPTSIGLLLAVYPPERRGGAVRAWAAIGGFAAALGPVVGGILLVASWRWIFLVNVPIGLVAIAIGWWKLPDVPGHDAPAPRPLDAALATGGIAALIFAIVKVNDWGWASPRIGVSVAAAIVLIGLFVWRCARLPNPFVDPALFRIRQFTGAALVMAPYSAGFGAMLLSIALWEQTAWGWSALKTGLAIAPGPLLVPITSLLFSGRLIARFGAAAVVTAGVGLFIAALVWWALATGLAPSVPAIVVGMILGGVGVGLTFPTALGIGASSLPPSSFATGSGVINMIRQAALAVGVAIFVAIVGSPSSPLERVARFHQGWWIMAAIVALSLIPTFALIRPAPARPPHSVR